MTNSLSLPQLRAAFTGQVIGPGDADYDQARTIFYGGFDRRPAVIIRPADDSEVARVVTLARDTGLPLAVRSGGHSNAGHSVVDGGIVLDLCSRRALTIDAAARTAWAEAGLTAGEYTNAAGVHNLATGFGDTGSVGLGGLTLGGGVGYLVRKHGLTIDSLLAADVVTADGQVLRVDPENHPDLFWAIRGGGGNFGVATRFQFRLHSVETVYGGLLVLPATAEVIESFVALADAAPEELSTIANIMPAPPMPFLTAEQQGQLVVLAMLVYAGPLDAGERAVAPFRALAAPLADLMHPMRYPEIYPPEEAEYHPIGAARNLFVDAVDHTAAQRIVDSLKASTAMLAVTQLRVLGGAMARVPAEATAYAHRQRRIMANVATLYQDPVEAPTHAAWVHTLAEALASKQPGAYVNFLSDEGPARVREAYPTPTWNRLAAIKQRYDPDNLFRLNQNIQPAAAAPER
jgi:FAD/FMN-containing dehydrogenase